MAMFIAILLLSFTVIALLAYRLPFYGPKGKSLKQRLISIRNLFGKGALVIGIVGSGLATIPICAQNLVDQFMPKQQDIRKGEEFGKDLQKKTKEIVKRSQNEAQDIINQSQSSQSYKSEVDNLSQHSHKLIRDNIEQASNFIDEVSASNPYRYLQPPKRIIENSKEYPKHYKRIIQSNGNKIAEIQTGKSCQNCQLSEELKARFGNSGTSASAEIDDKKADGLSLASADHPQLLVFVSASMPDKAVQALFEQVQAYNGKLIFRGLMGGSFQNTLSYMSRMEIKADIDPPKFSQYQITHTPTFVLTKGDVYDKLTGHISVEDAMEQFSSRGELKVQARALHKSKGAW